MGNIFTTSTSRTPLHKAANNGDIEEVKLLLSSHFLSDFGETHLVNEIDEKYGATPLYLAAEQGHHEVVELLLAQRAVEVNKADKDGFTPLCTSAWWGHDRVVQG